MNVRRYAKHGETAWNLLFAGCAGILLIGGFWSVAVVQPSHRSRAGNVSRHEATRPVVEPTDNVNQSGDSKPPCRSAASSDGPERRCVRSSRSAVGER
jgi:hypothetical protein